MPKTDWPVKTLGQMLELSYGKPLDAKDRDDNGSVPVYGANGVKAYSKKFLVSGPSIIVGRKGSAGELNFCEGPFWPLDVTYYVQHDANETDLSFLYYLLSLMDLPLLAKGVKPGINRNDVYALQAVLPPLAEQKRIVALLDVATSRVTELTACYEQARTHANNLFTSALRELMDDLDDTVEMTLADICIVDWGNTNLTKKSYLENGDYLAVSATGPDGHIGHAEHKAFTPVLSAIGARCGRMFLPEEDFTAIKNTITLTPKPEAASGKYIYFLFEHLSLPIRGAAQPFIAKGDIEKFKVAIPPLGRQEIIVDSLELLRAKTSEMVAAFDAKLTAAKNLRQSILEAAFGGDL
jgi:type I restriction enzyme S subunit